MTNITHDVVGIGNAIVDVLGRCDDQFLVEQDAPKGHMRLVDEATIAKIYGAMGPATEVSGGSAANTIVGVASFGGRAGYIGKVADDEFGRIFRHDLTASGVDYRTAAKSGGAPTARSLVLVTPDGERTMNTFLGVSPELDASDLDPALITGAKILYLEGYLFDRPKAQDAFRTAADMARKAGRQVALTLSDGFCVDRHRDAFLALMRDQIDIVFANKAELAALTGKTDFEAAVRETAALVPILAATRSEQGSVLVRNSERAEVPATAIETLIDTTGAGDLYAAGVLYGLSRGADLETCGRLGSLAASEVITHLGARPETSLSDLAKQSGIEV